MLGFPTIIVLGPDGQERDRIVGFDGNEKAFLEKLRNYADNKNTLAQYRKIQQQHPDSVEANFDLAQRYVARYELEKAQPYLKRVLELDPQNSYGYNRQARFHIAVYKAQRKNQPSPLRELVPELESQDRIETAFFVLARTYAAMEDTSQALKMYEQGMARLPKNADFKNSYAWFIYENKVEEKYQSGIQAARKAVSIAPESAPIWDTLAWLYYASGDTSKAIEAMEKASELEPKNIYYQDNLSTFRNPSTEQS